MKFNSFKVIAYPQEMVWETMRDHLHRISDLMDDIQSIEEVEREDLGPGKIKVVSEWHSAPRLPGVIVRNLKPGMLSWTDVAIWKDQAQACDWTIHSHYFGEKMKCEGSISFAEALKGEGCLVTFKGEINFAKEKLFNAGVFDKVASAALEKVLGKLIPGNFQKMAKGISGLLEQDQG